MKSLRFFTLLILLIASVGATAQTTWGVRNFFNGNDYNLGVKLGHYSDTIGLELYGFFDMRPFEKRVLVSDSRPFLLQLRETRYFVGTGVEYDFPASGDVGIYLMANIAYTWADYSGTEIKPEKGLVLIPGAGVSFSLGKTQIKLGYSYYDSRSLDVGNSKVYIAINGFLK